MQHRSKQHILRLKLQNIHQYISEVPYQTVALENYRAPSCSPYNLDSRVAQVLNQSGPMYLLGYQSRLLSSFGCVILAPFSTRYDASYRDLVIFVRCSRVCPVYFFLCNPGRLE